MIELLKAAFRGTPLQVKPETREPPDEAWPDFTIWVENRVVGSGEVKTKKLKTPTEEGLGQCLSYSRAHAAANNLLSGDRW